LEEISSAAICRVTEPTVAIAFQVEPCLSANARESNQHVTAQNIQVIPVT
jgi:hypothetical protein